VGDDDAAAKVRAQLREQSPMQTNDLLITDQSRPSTIKTRIIAHSQMVVRADRERRTPVDGQTEDAIIAAVRAALANADALVISDYDKGVITPRILSEVLPAALPTDAGANRSKIRNFSFYRPATLITPNHHEALRMTNTEQDRTRGCESPDKRFANNWRDAVLITRGDRGMILLEGKTIRCR
jgi:D-beta-D-heptose 7-phosphate kinase/D-beta-D-heptose 1-phosphate adenosyltransferase